MIYLVIGNGGREHAISHFLCKSKDVKKIYVSSGNGGTYLEDKCENVLLKTNEEILQFAIDKKVDLTIIGPEAYLVDGIVDLFHSKNLKIIGAHKDAAMLEGSKIFAKKFMEKYGVKTAKYIEFFSYDKAKKYAEENTNFPIVIKADGLAAGKGVVICNSKEETLNCLKEFMVYSKFGNASSKIIFEEFLEGFEASILSVYDGETILPFLSAKDHKQIYDGDKGPNTGGMGVISPNPFYTEEHNNSFLKNILEPTIKGINKENLNFKGFIFFGLMITKSDVYLLEYNIRLGDPETQGVLSLLENDFSELMIKCSNQNLKNYKLNWRNASSCCITLSSEGYPNKYEINKKIYNYTNNKTKVFHAGTKFEKNELFTNGGRVINVVSTDENISLARKKAYEVVENIKFEGKYFRKDIGQKI